MKKIIFFNLVIATVIACQTTPKQSTSVDETIGLSELMTNAEKLVGTEVSISGTVDHVCKHSGKRCFIIDSSGVNSIRIEAGDKIESFSQELLGTDILVKGVLAEKRVLSSEIDEMESEVKLKMLEEKTNHESCNAEMSNIESMRTWMQENGKDYYAVYYINGLNYEPIE